MNKQISDHRPFTIHNVARIIHGGAEYFSLLEQLINNTSHSIHLQTYIFSYDDTGRKIGDALMKAARRMVQVYLIVDGYASANLPQAFINQLKKAGVHFRYFQPLLNSEHFYIGRRMHHKTLVTDARYGVVGGLNVANHYNLLPGSIPWLDFALYVEGEICLKLFDVCSGVWGRKIPLPADHKTFLEKFRKSLVPLE